MELPVLKEMVEEFQCPGCTLGSNTKCGSFVPNSDGMGAMCNNHSAGTFMGGIGCIQLGLPKGFCRVRKPSLIGTKNYTNIRLHDKPETYQPDHLNVAVWAMEKDGYLFVRTYSPRIDATFVDVIKGGKLDLVPNAVNVGEFIDQID